MKEKIRIFTTPVNNPWFNLATEDWIFHDLPPDTHILFLWRNSDSVIIGRHQNAWSECKVTKIQREGAYLARRQTGGGAVFHDLGNTNFTFMSPKNDFDESRNYKIIIDALESLGIQAHRTGRNDLVVGDKKISGSAFKHASDRSFHHGTILVNTDMNKLSYYLHPNPLKLKSKRITSVRARVVNITEINSRVNNHHLCESIMMAFCQHYDQQVKAEVLDLDMLKKNPFLNKQYKLFSSNAWRLPKEFEDTHHWQKQFFWGIVDLHLQVKDDVINKIVIYSDSLYVDLVSEIIKVLKAQPYNPYGITTSLDALSEKYPDWADNIENILEWMLSNYQ